MLIEPIAHQRRELLDIAVLCGLFETGDAENLLGGVVDGIASQSLPQGHAAVACRFAPAGPIAGWAYFAPDADAEGVWNLWWIGVLPEHQGSGAGAALLTYVENTVHESGARLLVIETSDTEPMGRARRFYAKAGYTERGRIPEFYGDGEAKVVFSKRL